MFIYRTIIEKLLSGIIEAAGIDPELTSKVILCLDKLEKIGEEGVKSELMEMFVESSKINMLLDYMKMQPDEVAKKRFCEWMEISVVKNIVETDCVKAIELSCNENGAWRGQAVFFYQNDDWTVFEDLSGGIRTIPA